VPLELRFLSKTVERPSELKMVLNAVMKRHPDVPLQEIMDRAQAQYPYHAREEAQIWTKEEILAALRCY
jgi:hypothetical protein